MPRPFSEIRSDVNSAVRKDDAAQLVTLIAELDDHSADPAARMLSTFAQAVVFFLRGEMDASLKSYGDALPQAQAVGEDRLVTIILGNMANVHQLTGRHGEARKLYLEAHALHEQRGEHRDAARLLGNLGSVSVAMGHVDEAREFARRSLTEFTALNDAEGRARALIVLGMLDHNTGNDEAALVQLQEARAIFHQLGNEQTTVRCDIFIHNILSERGAMAEAYAGFVRALDVATRIDSTVDIAELYGHISGILSSHGDYVAAIEQNERALAVLKGRNLPFLEALHQNGIGVSYQRAGDYTRARRHFERARDLIGPNGPLGARSSVVMNLADLTMAEQRPAKAVPLFVEALDLARQLGRSHLIGLALANLVHALLDSSDEQGARHYLDELDMVNTGDVPVHIMRHLAHAKVHRLDGDLATARLSAEDALAVAETNDIPGLSVECHEILRDIAKQTMDFDGFVRHSEAVQQITNAIKGAETARRLELREAEQAVARERAETERHRTLLYSTLPKHIADRVARGEVVNDAFDNAAVLFLDIAGFTTNSSALDAGVVVELLHDIFTTFDAICEQHDVMKIKTIGDSYMAVAFGGDAVGARPRLALEPTGIPNVKPRLALEQRIANVACAMMSSPFTWPHTNERVMFRIGLHCGPVVAGVLGTERLQYDVWGDTVNVASRMESTSEPGRIHVSASFAESLNSPPSPLSHATLERGNIRLVERGIIDVKSKGAMRTYWLEREVR